MLKWEQKEFDRIANANADLIWERNNLRSQLEKAETTIAYLRMLLKEQNIFV